MSDPDRLVSESDILIDDRWVQDIKHHIEHGADLPTLLMTTAHVTGNLAVLRKERRPVDVLGVARCDVPQGFASPAHIPWAGR